MLTLLVLQWTIALSPPPPTDAPNVGNPTGPLRVGIFIIEVVDRVSQEQELSNHVIVFYNELIALMNAAGPSWQLIRKERYDEIKDVLIRIHNGEAVLHVRRDHPQSYKWSSFYALVNDGFSSWVKVLLNWWGTITAPITIPSISCPCSYGVTVVVISKVVKFPQSTDAENVAHFVKDYSIDFPTLNHIR